VPTYGYKLAAFGISCALAGVAGGIQALFVSYITAGGTFNITVPLTVVLMCVLGGTRFWAGPAIGATVITILLYATTAADQAIVGKAVVGVILVVAILVMPEGILGRVFRRRSRGGPPAPAPVPPSTSAHAEAFVAAVIAPPAVGGDRPVLLAVRAVAKSFKGVRALDGVDLDVREGEILGVIGPNGSGKSTLINIVSGHFRADAGTARFDGVDMLVLPAHRIARTGVARTYQIPRPFAHLTVRDNVALAAMFGGTALDRRHAAEAASHWLRFTGLGAHAEVYPGDLNLHQAKFLELARGLAARPRLLMLDEVLSGLTPAEIDEAVDLIRRIRAQGTTIVLVEHVMRVVTALAERLVVLDQGKVLAAGLTGEVMARSDVAAAYLGDPHA
jgi:branched-chain amino acid transport system permease protein